MTPAIFFAVLLALQGDFQTEFVKGLRALNEHDLIAAQSSLAAAARLKPDNARVQVALAQTYWRLKKSVLANEAALRAERFGAEDPVVLRALATFYAEQQKFSKAGDLEVLCAARDPQDAGAEPRAMNDYLQGGSPRKAIAVALAAADHETRADIRNLLGKAYEADGQILKTIPELQAAMRLKPDEEAYCFDLTQELLNHFNFDAAALVAEECRKRFPGSAQMPLAAGVAYYGQNLPTAAIDAFLNSIALDPSNEQPYLFLVRLLGQAQDRLPAIVKTFESYEARYPDSYLGYFAHAKGLLSQSNNSELIEKLLRKSIALDPSFWEAHFQLGIVLSSRHALPEAEKEFRGSIDLNPKDPVPHYRLFRVLAAQGKTREAEAELATQRRIAAEYQADLDRTTGEVKRLEIK